MIEFLKDTLDFTIVLAISTLCFLPVGYAIVYIFL